MAKELPYFQFEPAEYMASDISICSLEAQGLFTNILAIYWQKDCVLKMSHIEKRFNRPELLKELLNEGIFKVKKGVISINFLSRQKDALTRRKSRLSEAGKKGAAQRTDNQSNDKPPLSLDQATLKQPEEKRKEEKKEEDKPVVEVEVLNDEITEKQFLSKFKEFKEKAGGKFNQKALTMMERQNFRELVKQYKPKDFSMAIHSILCDKWRFERNQCTPYHLLNPQNFVRFLDSYDEDKKTASKQNIYH